MKSKSIQILTLTLIVVCISSVLYGCGSASTANKQGDKSVANKDNASQNQEDNKAVEFAKSVKVMTITDFKEDRPGIGKSIIDLSNEYKKNHPKFNLEYEVLSLDDLKKKIKILASSNDLPEMFTYESGAEALPFINNGWIANIEDTFKELGIYDQLLQTAVSSMKSIGNGQLYGIPIQLNMEGIWYNKKIFTDNGIEVPKTLTDLLAISKKLKDKNIQPFALAGKEKWPATRLINMITMRKLGVDNNAKAAKGELSYNDPAYIDAVKTLQDMANSGYFGQNSVSTDYLAGMTLFMTGKAAMMYMGSWMLSDLNDPKINTLGTDGVGFFNVPQVEGGVGKPDEYSMNCGMPFVLGKSKLDAGTKDWLKYVFSKFGDENMNKYGMVTGFKVTKMDDKVPGYTKLVVDELNKSKGSALWFEAKMDAKTTALAQDNVQMLLLNKITPEDYCKALDKSIKENMVK